MVLQPAKPETSLAEEGMKALEIATAGEGGGMGWGERVEFFGREVAKIHERTSRRAP